MCFPGCFRVIKPCCLNTTLMFLLFLLSNLILPAPSFLPPPSTSPLKYIHTYVFVSKHAFGATHWRRLLRAPWTARRSNQSIPKEISPGYSLEGLMLKLKLQYFGHLMRRADSFEKTLMLGKIEGKEEKGTTEDEMVGWHHWHNGHGFGWSPGVCDGQGGLVCCSSWGHKESYNN